MFSHILAIAGLLLAAVLPLVGRAQNASLRFYAGAGANLISDIPFNSAGVTRLIGPSLTAGFQLTPHLAVQTGVSYYWTKDAYSQAYYPALGNVTTYTSEHRNKYFFIPVLLRYTFTPSAERFHIDAFGGVNLFASIQRSTYTTSPAPTPQPDVRTYSSFDASLALGPTVRYSLSPQVELTASSTVNLIFQNYGRLSNRLFLNTYIGANYAFGQR